MANSAVNIVPDKREEEPILPKPKKSRKGLIIILGLILLMGAAGGGVFLLAPGILPDSLNPGGKKAAEKKEKAPEKKEQGHIYSMEPFVVNLADQGRARYLKIKMSIESQEIKVNEEYEKRLPQLRDTILTVLSGRTYGEIADSEGKKKLREEIILRLNQLLRGFQVKTVYFTEFMIQ